jgi:hypothetical protein
VVELAGEQGQWVGVEDRAELVLGQAEEMHETGRVGHHPVVAQYEERMIIARPPQDVIAAAPQVLAAAGFKNVQTYRDQWTVTATKWRPGQWTQDPVNVFLYSDPQGTQVIVQAQATAQSVFSLASSPSQANVRAAMGALARI